MKLKMGDHTRRHLYSGVIAAIVALVVMLTTASPAVFATPDDDTLDDFYRNDIYYYDPSAENCDPDDISSATSSKPSGDQITWIGDSYTEDAQGIIQRKLTGVDIYTQAHKQFAKDDVTDGYDNKSGLTIVNELKEKGDLRQYVIFALGNDDAADPTNAINTIIDDYLAKDQSLVLVTLRSKESGHSTINQKLKDAAEKHDNIILADWAETAKDHLNDYFKSDGVSLNSKGQKAWVNTIYDALPGGVSTLPGKNNEERVWNYFATANIKGVSDNAAVIAGIMGNIKQESDFNPFSKSGSMHGIYQTDNDHFIKDVEEKFGSSHWGEEKPPENMMAQAIAFELDWLTKKNERWLSTGWAEKFGFMKHLSNVKSDTPEAYSDLFVMAVEGAVTSSTISSNALKDRGVIELGSANFGGSSGGGKYYQEAQKRRTYAKQFFNKYAKQTTASTDLINSTDVAAASNHNQIASTTPVKIAKTEVADSSGSSQISTKVTHLDSQRKKFVKDHYQIAQKLSIAYGIPWETVVAQGIVESASGTSRLAKEKHNYFGIGAFDSCPYECAKSYPNETEGWKGYYENIRKTPTYREHGVFSGNTITDPMAYLIAIKAAGYATASDYIKTISGIILGVEEYAEEQGWKSSDELAAEHPEMLENAKKYAAGKGAAPTNLTDAENVCVDPSVDGMSDYDGSGFPWYNQCDDAWGSQTYGGFGSICQSGCGPTSFAMLATALTGKKITPNMTTKVAGDAGMHIQGSGSSWQITKVLADHYGLQYKDLSSSSKTQAINKINKALKDGWMIHTSGKGSNPFTSGGHYIGIRGITEDGKWLLADSAGSRGKENTQSKAFSPNAVVSAGMNVGNIKAIKAQ